MPQLDLTDGEQDRQDHGRPGNGSIGEDQYFLAVPAIDEGTNDRTKESKW